MRLRTALVAAMAGLSLAGCATVRGSQDAPAAFTPSGPLVSFNDALERYNKTADSARGDMTRDRYRDYVIDLYLADVENKYRELKAQLITADRGSALAGDLLMLGLTGATALAGEGAIDELATITAVAAGTRASIDKRLFFDRTMPAVIAAMDAKRAIIKAEIAIKRRLPEGQYSFGEAMVDVIRLADAGNINNGIERITVSAAADREAAEARLNKIPAGCSEATGDTARLNAEFMALLRVDAALQPGRLEEAAKLLGVTAETGQALTLGQIAKAFDEKFCGDIGKPGFIALLKQRITAREGGGDGND